MVAAESRTPDHVGAQSRSADLWRRLLIVSVSAVAAYDVVFLALIGEVVPALLAGAVLTVIGIGLLPQLRRTGIVVLGVTSLVLLVGTLPFAADHLPHPRSAIDFTHAVIGLLGRAAAVVAAIGAWRQASAAVARRVLTLLVALLATSLVVSGVAVVSGSSDRAVAGDVTATLVDSAFPAQLTVPSGGAIHLENLDRFRHTYTVAGTSLDVELPASSAVRFTVDLDPGSYDVICEIPGHEFMSARLVVD